MKEIIQRISQEMVSHTKLFAEKPLSPIRTDSKVFPFKLSNFNNVRLDNSIKEITFIDGGSYEIVSSNSFSIYIIRVAGVTYKENVKQFFKIRNFFVLIKSEYQDELIYTAKIFPIEDSSNHEIIKFNASDSTLREGVNNGELSKIGSVVRRFFELKFAKEYVKNVSERSILILDGSLQCTYTGEQKYMNDLLKNLKLKEILLMSIAKTNSLSTDTGASVESVLKNISNELPNGYNMWFYHPLIKLDSEDYSADIMMAKLHKRSKHIFKVEISNKFNLVNYSKIFGCLAINSADPVFLGYPFGLVKADELARIDKENASYLRMRFLKNIDDVNFESSKNAHSILDSIRF